MTSLKVSLVKLSCLSFMLLCYITVFKTNADSSFTEQNDPSPLVEELRGKIQSLGLRSSMTTDKMLARYIEDSRYRVNRAERQLQRTARWRKAANVDTLLNWTPPEVLSSNLPYECTGTTDEGNPIYYIPFGEWNFTRVQEAGQAPEIYNYGVRLLEDISNSTRDRIGPHGEQVDQAVVIIDASGYSIRSLINLRATSAIIRLARDVDRHYPFAVKKFYVVRAGVSFRALYAAVSRAISRNRRESFEILSSFSLLGRGARVLSHNIPANALPVELGGKYVLRYKTRGQDPSLTITIFNSNNTFTDSSSNNNNNDNNESVVLDSLNNINSNFNNNNNNIRNDNNVAIPITPSTATNNIRNDNNNNFVNNVTPTAANNIRNDNDNNFVNNVSPTAANNNIRNENTFSNNVNSNTVNYNSQPSSSNSNNNLNSFNNNNNFKDASAGGYNYYTSSSNQNQQYQYYSS